MKSGWRSWEIITAGIILVLVIVAVTVFLVIFKFESAVSDPNNVASQTVSFLRGKEIGYENDDIASASAVELPKNLRVYHDPFGENRRTETVEMSGNRWLTAVTFEDEPGVKYVFAKKAGNIQDIIHRDRLVMIQVTEDYDGHEFLHADEFMWYGE